MPAAGISVSGHVEAEVKVRCAHFEALREAHPELGWDTASPRHFEDNLIFDLPSEVLKHRGAILRIRIVGGKATLTYKGIIPESFTSSMKVREELETEVSDAEMLARIFEALGFKRIFRYQKFRTVYRLVSPAGEVLAMRDELPFGDFLELEGDEAIVGRIASVLGFAQDDYIRESYIGIQAGLCAARGLSSLQDLTFP